MNYAIQFVSDWPLISGLAIITYARSTEYIIIKFLEERSHSEISMVVQVGFQ